MERPPRKPGTKIATRAQTVRWVVGGFLIAAPALLLLSYGPDEPSTTVGSVSMTMAFAVVALAGVNTGLMLRRERQPFWASPLFPYMGWVMLGWFLTWAAVELGMFQRLLTTVSLTGGQWVVVIALSLVGPLFVAVDKQIQMRRSRS
jgi:Ca2+-transporting ATPase